MHHYSTFTDDTQARRFAALQEWAKEYEEERQEESKWSNVAKRASERIGEWFRTCLYRAGMACLPCLELLAAFNLLPRLGRKARRDDGGEEGREDATLISGKSSVAGSIVEDAEEDAAEGVVKASKKKESSLEKPSEEE